MANLLAISGGSWMVVNGSLTLGELTSFMMYLGLMIWPMLALARMFNIVERGCRLQPHPRHAGGSAGG